MVLPLSFFSFFENAVTLSAVACIHKQNRPTPNKNESEETIMNNTIINQELSMEDLNNVVGGARVPGKIISNGLYIASPIVSNYPINRPNIRTR